MSGKKKKEKVREEKTVLDEKVSPREKFKEIGALFFVLCAAFVFISLVTYTPQDNPANHYDSTGGPVMNKGGRLGAELAYTLFSVLGVAAYVLVFFAGFWSFLVFFRRRVRGLYIKLIAAGVTVMASATLMSFQPFFTASAFGLDSTTPSLGGIYGEALSRNLVDNCGPAGAMLCIMLSLMVSLVLATDWMVYTGVIRLSKVGMAGWKRLQAHYSPEAREARRAERAEKVRAELADAVERERMTAPVAVEEPPMPPPPAVVRPEPVVEPDDPPEKGKKISPTLPAVQANHQVCGKYEPPPLKMFDRNVEKVHRSVKDSDIKERMLLIEQVLREFGIEVKVVNYEVGPSVTIYELSLAPGTSIQRVAARQDEISMKLGVPPVRVVGPIPGKKTVGVEVPNPFPDSVRMREFLNEDPESLRKIPLPIVLGKTNSGDCVLRSLSEMPHLLIAGTTGSGKSVCLKAVVTSLLCGRSWDEMKLILIDPKMVELSAFADIPHLWAPVVTDSKKAAMVLDWTVKEMEERYRMLSKIGSRDIQSYNGLGKKKLQERFAERGVPEEQREQFPDKLPYIVVVIDELADLMMTAKKDVESSIIRIAQKARAVGIHMVVATQRPSADVITGLIKSNMPSRIAFRVASAMESRIILDNKGAERLLGKGDMLFLLQGTFEAIRAQCTFISEEEVRRVVKYLKSKGKPVYNNELVEIDTVNQIEGTAEDDLYNEAVEIVIREQRGSVSLLQRKLSIGYTRAARLVDAMEHTGVVGAHTGSSAREVLLTPEQWAGLKARG